MGKIQAKPVFGKLSVLKDYSSLVVPIIIAVVALLIFIPTQVMSGKLKDEMSKRSIRKAKEIQRLIKEPISSSQWQEEEKYQQAYANDANQIAVLNNQSTQRPLISYKIFPEPKDTSPLIFEGFGNKYRGLIDNLIAEMKALDCPSEVELSNSLKSFAPTSSGTRWGDRRPVESLGETEAIIRDELCQTKALSASVYTNAVDISGYELWEQYRSAGVEKAVEDCWYWQLAYWIIEDVGVTVKNLNLGSESVFTSPVKRLLYVDFEKTGEGKMGEGARGKRPEYVLEAKNGLVVSHTKRACDKEKNIDVVHFRIGVVVSTKAILPFQKELCSAKSHTFSGFFNEGPEQRFKHNQITILEYSISPVDRDDQGHALYRYGEDAVVELDLVCEYIFNKSGYSEIKPKQIKQLLEPQGVQGGGAMMEGRRERY